MSAAHDLPPVRQHVVELEDVLLFIGNAAGLRYGSVVLHPDQYDLVQRHYAPAGKFALHGVRLVSSVFAERGYAVALPPPHPHLVTPEPTPGGPRAGS